jgi:serine/threonine protein kinase
VLEELAPLRLDDFRLESQIGKGAMGTVHRATQLSLNKPVAVKILHVSGPRQRDAIDRFLAEGRVVASLRHENIVDVHGVGRTSDGQLFLVMDLIDGSNLAERLRHGPLSIREAAHVVRQVARAVGHAHARGIIHRDLKPSNVLLDGSGRIFLTDFGLARPSDSSSNTNRPGQVVGTPGFMAPEQVSVDYGVIGPRVDVFGLGALLYALLTNQPPIAGGSDVERMLQTATPQPVQSPRLLRPEIPRALESICLKCLAKCADTRFQSAREAEDALQRFLEEHAAGQFGEHMQGKLPTTGRTGRRAYPLLTTAAPLVVVAGLLLWDPLGWRQPFRTESNAVFSAVSAPVGVNWTIDLSRSGERPIRISEQPVPIAQGDGLRIAFELSDDRYCYLYWIGSDSSASRLFPVAAADAVHKSNRISLPQSLGKSYPIQGPSGIEIGVLLLRSEPLSDLELPIQRLQGMARERIRGEFTTIIDGVEVPEIGGIQPTRNVLQPLGHDPRSLGAPEAHDPAGPGQILTVWIEEAVGDLGQVSFVALRHDDLP